MPPPPLRSYCPMGHVMGVLVAEVVLTMESSAKDCLVSTDLVLPCGGSLASDHD